MKAHHAAAGAASVFDLSTQLRQPHVLYQRLGLPPHVADALSLAKDWRRVGEDLESAILACAEILAEHPTALEAVHEHGDQLELFGPECHLASSGEEVREATERVNKALREILEAEIDATASTKD